MMIKEVDFDQIAYELAVNRPPYLRDTIAVALDVLKRMDLPPVAGVHLVSQGRLIEEDISIQLATNGLASDLFRSRISPAAVLDLSPPTAICKDTPDGPQFLFSVEHFGVPFIEPLKSDPEASAVGSVMMFYALACLSFDNAPREIELPKNPQLEADFIEEVGKLLAEASVRYSHPQRLIEYAEQFKEALAGSADTAFIGKGAEIQFRQGPKTYLFKNHIEHTSTLRKLARFATREFEKVMKKRDPSLLRLDECSTRWQKFFTEQIDTEDETANNRIAHYLNPRALNQAFLISELARLAYERLLKEYSVETLAMRLKEALTAGNYLAEEEPVNHFPSAKEAGDETKQTSEVQGLETELDDDDEEFMRGIKKIKTRRVRPRWYD